MGGSLPYFNFFNVNPQIFQRYRKIHLSDCQEKISMQIGAEAYTHSLTGHGLFTIFLTLV